MPKGFPSEERVSCVCKASSLVGAMTRTEIVELLLALRGLLRRWHSAGMPNASVFPLEHQKSIIFSRTIHPLAETDLPVSAIPTTSFPFKAGGQLHACIGVGSLNPANAD